MTFSHRITTISLLLLTELAIATHPAFSARTAPSAPPNLPTEDLPLSIASPSFELALRFRSRRTTTWRRWGAPRWSIGGAARGGCTPAEAPLVPLMPVTNVTESYPSFSALTVDEHPTFFAYVPETVARSVEFLLIDEESGDVVFEPPALTIDGSSQIVSFRYESTLPPLEVGKTYTWYFTLVCGNAYNRPDLNDNSGNPFVRGWVQRVTADPNLSRTLEQTALRDRPSLYAEAGIWLDTLTSLAQLRCTSPNDASLTSDWSELMQELELYRIPDLSNLVQRNELAIAPLSQCSALR